ncbi:FAD-dependent monooxygenase [Bradyrhizobium sp. U87765 SZCCT0131]|uniref:FAD binding domain-containing protein n=1 Tax=unclassified Bradyrhizobium TaxID=2631580 RepID=UPI001BA66576|nr:MULTISPECIES: FAD-dependent monooxygenase [unclassified Bradyrhizobium]MBR1221498.1 FAD-dependent monooxygenase [Bradyrhizobium sp. U87765 SZCCT0131]MBR1264579.1 FAD-dependent monooxygenase [Bradyrhizobium sp. U87765 SZCCT0134]MBR1304515.1 FAD-dependent monooxygenase [Bradyrhizobium sp. U87765 SZCCT0110]MBR1322628.1 FAD-dependent monooxygenase [Bradyrhizobium sp. U87765 SZCCT0109]MBR1346444.1 FAD-dependent monooxygenase [Bradyrhizobium sp. U87765 SZCCT0048]
MSWHTEHGFTVTISGGSIAGLCNAIVLRKLGATVSVHERKPGPMMARGAGIVVQTELLRLLEDNGAGPLPFTSCRGRRYLDHDGGDGTLQDMPQEFTSWEAVHAALRAAVPDECYRAGSEVTTVTQNGSRVLAALSDGTEIDSDLFVAADGSGSVTRQRLLPDVEARYAGYVAWRGTLDERDVPRDLLPFFDDRFTFSEARSGGHMLAYFIPGRDGAVSTGLRRLNWVRYVHVGAADLAHVLTDKNGVQHRSSLPRGVTEEATVAALRARASREIHPKMAALVAETPDPFLQTIRDVTVPKTLFGRILLTGDAAFVVRPHTAGGTAKAAYEASVLARTLKSARSNVDVALQSTERLQLEYGSALYQYGLALGQRWSREKSTD